jgi:thiosulfate/3-mercaptopyruvate sulfurtransferase
MQKKILLLLSSLLFIALVVLGCKDRSEEPISTDNQVITKSVASCEGCHTNYDNLKKVYTPDPPSEGGGGCGGETPHIEPYDRVYLSGIGYQEFKNDVHGKIPCTTCHNGVDGTDNKTVAHSGNFIKHPSTNSEQKCGSCHTDITLRTKNSLHEQGWGQKSMVLLRSGLPNIPAGFSQLSQVMKDGYDVNCGKCHGTCGDCHVNRPKAGGGGLANGHAFTKTPDMRNVCVTCHVSRGGHAYFGQATGTVPDVHLTNRQFTCIRCHTKNEIHGDGNIYDQRYKMALLPKCTDCHASVSNTNSYHAAHLNTFSCNTCHSQDYNNCGSCHIGGEGARIPSYQGFKIGMNPIPDTKPYKYAVLRRSLMAPDSWKNYGVANLANFSVRPTYKYATPHNIIRWTKRTTVDSGKPCYDACHIIKNSDGSYKNKELYLFRSELESWEVTATQNITVDNKLPAKWDVK